MGVFVIAEAGSTWRQVRTPEQLQGTGIGAEGYLATARRSIEAAKECGADAWKCQWTSNAEAMAARRGHPEWAEGYRKWLQYPAELLPALKSLCDAAGIEFMCTVYLIEDIATIAPLVKRFKVSAFESQWEEFIKAHPRDRGMIVSFNSHPHNWTGYINQLYCVSKYPTPLEDLHFATVAPYGFEDGGYLGFSDHTTSLLTGALSVAAGGSIVEKHIRLHDTDKANPDYGHSLIADAQDDDPPGHSNFGAYVEYIREAEKAL